MSTRDYYDVLGVSHGASPDEIRKAYRVEAARAHPDVNPGDEEAANRYSEVASAFEVLRDVEKKAKYDAFISPPELVAQFFTKVEAGARTMFQHLGRAPKDAKPGPHMVSVIGVSRQIMREGGVLEVEHVEDSELEGSFKVLVPAGAYQTPWCRVRGAGAKGEKNHYEEYPDGVHGDLFLLLVEKDT